MLPPNYTTNKSTPGGGGGTQAFSGNLWGTFKLWDNSEVADNFENLRAEGRGILSSGYFAFGASFGENIGVGTLTSAYEGRNAAGEKLSPGGRALYAVGGLGELALNVVGLKGAVVSARAAPQAARVALRNGTRAYQGAKAALQTGWKQLIDWRTARRAVDGKLDEALEQLGKTADNTLKEVADDFAKPVTVEVAKGLANTADSVTDKLRRYLLDKRHPAGGSKAKWFDEALGFTQNNLDDLARQIKFDPAKAVQTAVTEHGTKFNQVIEIVGANGKRINVMFAWIKNNDGIIRLVTGIPTPK